MRKNQEVYTQAPSKCEFYTHNDHEQVKSLNVLIRKNIKHALSLLTPPSLCVLCNHYHRGPLAVCKSCNTFFARLGPACQFCAHPLPDHHFLVCGHCCKKKPFFDKVAAAYKFEGPIRTLLHEFKYHRGLYLTSFITELMLESLPDNLTRASCLVPVPMHYKRLKVRGFNQAAELTKHLARSLQLPFDLSHCKKMVNTKPQAELNGSERKKNLQGAFYTGSNPYQHVIIIDDLLTTGSTANELAHTLKKNGTQQVDVWCCARVAGIN